MRSVYHTMFLVRTYEALMQAMVLSSTPNCHKEKESASPTLENPPREKNLTFLSRKLSLLENFLSPSLWIHSFSLHYLKITFPFLKKREMFLRDSSTDGVGTLFCCVY